MNTRQKGLVGAVFGYAFVVFLIFRSVWSAPGNTLLFGDDIHRAYYFFREYFLVWIRQGIWAWWNPYLFSGTPFIANPVVNIWYPLTWLYMVFPLSTAFLVHISFHLVWAMTGMYVLVRSFLSEKATGSIYTAISAWVSGIIFGLSGFFAARIWAGHVDMIAAASWMPWVVWSFWRLIGSPGSRRRMAIAAVLFAMQLFSGYQTMAFFTVMAVGAVAVGASMTKRRWFPLVRSILAGGLGLGVAAIQIIPEAEFFQRSIRTMRMPYTWISYGSWEWGSIIQLLNPFVFGNQHTYQGPPPNFVEHSAFIGATGALLVCLGVMQIVRRYRNRPKQPYVVFGFVCMALVLFGIWVSLGPHAPLDILHWLWSVIPMYRYLRIPPRHLILVVFAASGLVGVGMMAVSRIGVRMVRHSIMGIMVVAAVVEMIWFAHGFVGVKPIPELRHDAKLLALLSSDNQPYRTLQNFGVWLPERDAMDFDSPMSYGIFSATGYDPSILRTYYEYVARAAGETGVQAITEQDVQVPYLTPRAADTLDFLNVKYIMVPPEYDPFVGNARYAFVRESTQYQYRLYENTTVKPRFFLENGGCGTAQILSYTPNSIRVAVNTSCPTRLMSSEVWYPGWSATIDGKKVNRDNTDNTFRTLFVQSGNHTIDWQYQPIVFVWSSMVSAVFGGIILWMWMSWRKRGGQANILTANRTRKSSS